MASTVRAGRRAALSCLRCWSERWRGWARRPPRTIRRRRAGPPIERLFAPVKEAMKDLPPFLRDTDLRIHWRSYYFNRENPGRHRERGLGVRRLAQLQVRLALRRVRDRGDLLRLGAALRAGRQGRDAAPQAGSGRVLRPRRGLRRAPVPGLRPREGLPAAGRPALHQPHGQPDDPEHVRGPHRRRQGRRASSTSAGYLWKIKPRNEDDFIFMSQQAGAAGSDDGVILGRVR